MKKNAGVLEVHDITDFIPQFKVAYEGNESLVSLLMNRGVEMGVTDNKDKTSTKYAYEENFQDIVYFMKQKKFIESNSYATASLSTILNEEKYKNVTDLSYLHRAVQGNSYSKIRDLLLQGLDSNQQLNRALAGSCLREKMGIISFLFDRCSLTNLKDNKRDTSFVYVLNNNQ